MMIDELMPRCEKSPARNAGPAAGLVTTDIVRRYQGQHWQTTDLVAEEVAVALVYNGISHAVMLASPLELEDFAFGFSWSEGLIEKASEIRDIEIQRVAHGLEVQIEVSPACEMRLKARRRTLAGRTGCGLCGTDSLKHVRRELPPVSSGNGSDGIRTVDIEALISAQSRLHDHQTLQQVCGAVHAAAWCHADGRIACLREDIGRHNALDKLIGALHHAGLDASRGFVLITSRASFEMVQKTATLGVGILAAVSAPTSMAVQTALDCNIALAGFVRSQGLVTYTYPDRFEPINSNLQIENLQVTKYDER